MIKVKNKILLFILLGLFLSISSSLFAADDKSTVVTPQNAWEFLKKNISTDEYNRFLKEFGTGEKAVINQNIVLCGFASCNTQGSKCMARKREKFMPEIGSSSLSDKDKPAEDESIEISAYTLFGNPDYEYACVPFFDSSKKDSDGWQDVTEQLKEYTKKMAEEAQKAKEERLKNFEGCYNATASTGNVKQYCVKVIGDRIEVTSANSSGNGCEVIPVNLYNNSKCRFCSLLGIVVAAAENITTISRNKLSWSFAIVIALGLGIWIAMKTLAFVSSTTKQDAAKYITELLKQGYKFMIAFFLLIYFNDAFNFIINPLLNAGLNFGTQFVTNEYSLAKRFNIPDLSRASFESLGEDLPSDYARNLNNKYYNISTYAALENFAYNVNLKYALLQSIGNGLGCLGLKYIILQLGNEGELIGLGLGCIIYGLFFWVFGFLLSLAFIFYIFDAVVQLGIVGGLLPFLIASWPFKITSKYTSTGFKMLLNSIFTFIMMGMVVMIGIALVSKAVELNTSVKVDSESGSGILLLADAINKIDTNTLKVMVNILSVGFLVFLFASILGFLLLARISELTDRFASGGMKAAAPSIATMGASTIKGMASKVTAPTREAIGDWVDTKTRKLTRKGVNFATGLVTGRFLRNWAYNKINKATSSQSNSSNTGNSQTGGQRNSSASSQTRATVGNNNRAQSNNQQTTATVGSRQRTNSQPNTPNTPQNSNSSYNTPSSSDTGNMSSGNNEATSSQATVGRRPDKEKMDELD